MKNKIIVIVAMLTVSAMELFAEEDIWTYYETATNTKTKIGSGYIESKLWKLYAERSLSKDLENLTVSGYKGEFYGTEPAPINLTYVEDGLNPDIKYKVTKITKITGSSENERLYNNRMNITEFIAPYCTAVSTDQYAFYRCSAMTNVVFSSEISTISDKSFAECYNLENFYPTRILCTSIGYQCFNNCRKLNVKFEFPNLTSLGSQAFIYCYALKGVSLPNIKAVSSRAFEECNEIEEVYAPNATNVAQTAFKNCSKLAKVTLSNEVMQVSQGAFSGCASLDPEFLNKYLGKSLRYIGFTDFKTTGSEFSGCKLLTSLNWRFPNLQTNVVNGSCFSGCSSLGKVVFKTPVVEIRGSAFWNIKPGAQVYMHKEVPSVYGALAVSRIADGQAYPQIFLSGNEEEWLKVIGENNTVIRKEEFNGAECLKNYASYMIKDDSVCDFEEVVSGKTTTISRVWMKKRGVIAFVYYAGKSDKYGAWVMRAPQQGFSVKIR